MADSPKEKTTMPLTPAEYMDERVVFKINAYTRKGDRYRWGYIITAASATVAAATVPVLINMKSVPSLVPTLVSLLVTILVGLEGVLHLREHWRNYDLMKSYLRQEMNLFRSSSGVYLEAAEKGTDFKLFVERVEAEIARERSQTIELRTARESDSGGKRPSDKDT